MTLDINSNKIDAIYEQANNNLFLCNKDYVNNGLDETKASVNSFIRDIIQNKGNSDIKTTQIGNLSFSYSEGKNPNSPKKPSIDENLSSAIINKDISLNELNNHSITTKKKPKLIDRIISIFRKKEEENTAIKTNNNSQSLDNGQKENIKEKPTNEEIDKLVKIQIDNIINPVTQAMTMEELIKECNPSGEKGTEIKFITRKKPTTEELEMEKMQEEKSLEHMRKSAEYHIIKKYSGEKAMTMDEYLRENNIDNNPKDGGINFIDTNSDIYKKARERAKIALKTAKRLREKENSIA